MHRPGWTTEREIEMVEWCTTNGLRLLCSFCSKAFCISSSPWVKRLLFVWVHRGTEWIYMPDICLCLHLHRCCCIRTEQPLQVVIVISETLAPTQSNGAHFRCKWTILLQYTSSKFSHFQAVTFKYAQHPCKQGLHLLTHRINKTWLNVHKEP